MTPGVWIVSELYYPEETSTGYFLTGIAEGLATTCRVQVLCSQPTYAARGRRAQPSEVRHGVQITRCHGTTFDKDLLLLRAINIVTITALMFFQALWRIRSGSTVVVVTNPPLLPFFIAIACVLKRCRCYLLVHDVYPEVLVTCGLIGARSVVRRAIDSANQLLLSTVDHIIVLGRDMEALLSHKVGGRRDRITVIPNWGDVDGISPVDRRENDLLAALGLADKFIIQYSGNMGRSHNLEDLVEVAGMLREQEQLHFMFIGWGAKRRWLERAVSEAGLNNVTVLDNQPRNKLSMSLNACDVAVISFIAGMTGVSVPSRLYNILAAGKPIVAICDDESEIAKVLKETDTGWVVPPGQPATVARIIREASKQPRLLREMGARARHIAETRFSHAHVIQQYSSLLLGA